MAKRRPKRRKKAKPQSSQNIQIEPWIKKRNGFIYIGILSVALAVFTGWQLYPSEGLSRSIMFGLGFGVAIWIVFGVSLTFGEWMRGRRQRR